MSRCLKTLLFLSFILSSSGSFAAEFTPVIPAGCGIYTIRGYVRKLRDHFVLRTLEGSVRETNFILDADLSEVAALYSGKAVDVTGEIDFPILNYTGSLHSTKTAQEIVRVREVDRPYAARFIREDFRERVPDPLTAETDSGFKAISPSKCR